MAERWSPYFANPPFVVSVEVRRAVRVGASGGIGMAALGVRFVLKGQVHLSDLAGLLAIACFFGVILTALGLWVDFSTSKDAAQRVGQPLVVIWPRLGTSATGPAEVARSAQPHSPDALG